eukprot:6536071-Prymnesium_polylepis.1
MCTHRTRASGAPPTLNSGHTSRRADEFSAGSRRLTTRSLRRGPRMHTPRCASTRQIASMAT